MGHGGDSLGDDGASQMRRGGQVAGEDARDSFIHGSVDRLLSDARPFGHGVIVRLAPRAIYPCDPSGHGRRTPAMNAPDQDPTAAGVLTPLVHTTPASLGQEATSGNQSRSRS